MTISDCQTSDNAAGIYFDKGKYLKLENCEISGCKGEGGNSSGGIDIREPKGTVLMKDTAITDCDGKDGGIHIADGSSAFNMSGSTVIKVEPRGKLTDPNKNDVYLTDHVFIALTGSLFGAEPIARITLNSSGHDGYKDDREVVKDDSGFTITADIKINLQ